MTRQVEKTKTCECGAEIFFGNHAGKSVPLEARVVYVYVPANQLGKTVYAPVAGHFNHFKHCPLRDKFRKNRG